MTKNTEWAFDFERALATWRQFVSRNPAIREVDLDELENHLRDAYEAFLRKGMSPEQAFDAAKDDVGNLSHLEESYREVHHEKMFRPGAIRGEMAVLKETVSNYIKSAGRNAARQRGITVLNVVGLSLAMAAALIISLFIRHSLSFDRFHGSDPIYRIEQQRGTWGTVARPPYGLADLIEKEWSGIKSITEASGTQSVSNQLSIDQVDFMIDGVLQVDESFLDVFAFDLVETDHPQPLLPDNAIILTESTAQRLFGSENPIGKTIRFEASKDLVVTAIAADPPTNTHLPFNALVRGFDSPRDLRWSYLGAFTYLTFNSPSGPAELIAYLDERLSQENPGMVATFSMQPVTDIHLHSEVQDDYAPTGDVRYLYLFGLIGVLILALAGINYVNMAAAQASRRTREIGVRKVIGASDRHVRGQFILESLLVTLLSIPFALVLVAIALPRISAVAGERIPVSILSDPMSWVILLGLVAIVSLAAGIYPAIIMARKEPVEIFSGSRSAGRTRNGVRKTLVGVQVAISFGMIVITLIVSAQMQLISDSNLGFDKAQIVTLQPRAWSADKFARFKQEAESNVAVESVVAGQPLGVGWKYFTWKTRPDESSDQEIELEMLMVGTGFIETMGLEVIHGRAFQEEDLTMDPKPVVVSESWVKLFGHEEPVIGRQITNSMGPIVGVVKEVQNTSLNDEDNITLFQLSTDDVRGIMVKLAPGRIQDGLAVLGEAWETIETERAFNYRFLDEHIASQYAVEERLKRFFFWFAGLSIVIAALGIFGLAALTARQRDKEIAIRKSLGATESSILMLLNREFLTVVLAGIVVATPLAWIYGNQWLESFSQQIEINGLHFVWAALVCVAFVALSVSVQSVRAARANPVDALKWD